MALMIRVAVFCLSATDSPFDAWQLQRRAGLAVLALVAVLIIVLLVWWYLVLRTREQSREPGLPIHPMASAELRRGGMMGSIWWERAIWVVAAAVAVIGGALLTSSPYPIAPAWAALWALAMFLTMALIRAAAGWHGSEPAARALLDVVLLLAVGVVAFAVFRATETVPAAIATGLVGLLILLLAHRLVHVSGVPLVWYRERVRATEERLQASGRAHEIRERRRRRQTIALVTCALMACLMTGLTVVGVVPELLGIILWFAAILVAVMLLRSAAADHGWGAIGLWVLDVLAAIIIISTAAFAWGFSFYGYFAALLGLGMLIVSRRWLGPEPQLSRRGITADLLLPPARRRGATLVSVLVAMGIVGMTMTLALRAYWQGSRLASLEHQRTLAAAECQAQLEQARARGWDALPGVGEHEFRAEAGEGRLTVAPGPVEGSRHLAARVSWPRRDDIPAGSVELLTIMSARGVGG